MNRTLLTLALPLAALAACGQEPQGSVAEENKERAEAAAAPADPDALIPGRWETKSSIGSVSNSGLTAEGRGQVAAQESALDQCLEPEEARRPDANFFVGGDSGECEYTKLVMAEGRLDATMSCTATPGSTTITLAGVYTPISYELDASATTAGTGGAAQTTTARLSGTWLGPCGDPDAQRAPEDPAR